MTYAEELFVSWGPMHAKTKGETIVGDALQIAKTLNRSDLVFVDPPYSAVQYSRFYHVLENCLCSGTVHRGIRHRPISATTTAARLCF